MGYNNWFSGSTFVSVQVVHFESKLSQFTIIGPHVVQYAIKFVMDYHKRSNNNRKKRMNNPETQVTMVGFMVLKTTFNNISVISWRSVL